MDVGIIEVVNGIAFATSAGNTGPLATVDAVCKGRAKSGTKDSWEALRRLGMGEGASGKGCVEDDVVIRQGEVIMLDPDGRIGAKKGGNKTFGEAKLLCNVLFTGNLEKSEGAIRLWLTGTSRL